jgi:C4-dicarboxylate-specific signal transduction histidine kinase
MSAIGQPATNDKARLGPLDSDAEPILVVEDDAALLGLMERCLNTGGHRTVGATDGASALAWLKDHSPSLIVLDYSLPDMRGAELIERFETLGRRVPFVVATGHGSESLAVEMMKRGASDYLVKGAMFLKLLPPVVDTALARARQARRLAQAEQQLREAHEELELRVEQRTAELARANQRLRVEMEERHRAEEQSQQHQAELAHVARLSTVGEMVAELAHELNQPLSAISSYAQACRRLLCSGRTGDPEELLASLNQVGEQADRAAEIIRRVRRFVTKAKPLQTALDLNLLIRDVEELTNIDARRARAEVCFDLAEPLPPVVGDRIQLEQVLVNLLRNAFEALGECPSESRRVAIRAAVVPGSRIQVDVCDNGVGIAPDLAQQVFDRFFTTKPSGMGMGLPISQSIIENHGGTLWMTGNVEGGSTFHFTLPVDLGENGCGS